MRTLLEDFRYALRMLLKSPGFTVVAVLTLALGIGANTAIFSVVNGLLLHPYGIPHPERLLAIRARYEKLNLKSIVISAPDYTFVRDNKQTFAAAAIETENDFNYAAGAWPLRLRGARVSWQWFDVFEARPLLGRVFAPEEDQPNADHEVVLAYGAWKSIFGGDQDIVGRSIQLNQQPYKIIGVMEQDFEWPSQTDLWAPLGLAPDAFSLDNIFNENYLAVARLEARVKPSSAAVFLKMTSQRISDDPRTQGYPKASGWSLFAIPFTEFVYGDVRTPLLILLGAVGLVLLIACSNVAGLLLARASARARVCRSHGARRFTVALGSPDAHGKHGAGFRGHGARSVDCFPGGSCLAVACSGESFHRFGHSFGLVCASLYRLACRSLCHHFRRCSGVADRLSRSTPKPEARPRHWRGKRWPPSLPQRARRSGAFPGPAAARQRRRVPEEFAEAQRCRHWLSSPWLDDRRIRLARAPVRYAGQTNCVS